MSSRKRTRLFGMRNGKKAMFLLCVFMLGLISLAFADGSYGATIQGVKYNDLNGNGEWNEGEPFLANHDVMILSHETAESFDTKTNANGEYTFNVAAGKYMIWSGIPEGWCQTAPVQGTGQVSDTANATNAGAEIINFGIVQSDDCKLEVYPACEYEDHDDDYWDKQVETIDSGSWNDPAIWSTGQVPGKTSHVVIGSGHSITVPNSKIDLGRSSGTLCINEAVKGGDGGVIRVFTNIFDADNPSTNQSGKFISGAGGFARGPNPIPGAGGALEIYMKEIGGTHQGAAGGRSVVDPIHLKAASDLMMFGSDWVELFTNEGGTIDLTALRQSEALENGESPIRANKIIRIVTKSKDGHGGIVNLKGIQGKVFKAGEKVEIFADTILLDDGTTVNDLSDAPNVVTGPGRVVYSVAISGNKEMFGSPDKTRMLYLNVLNKGPKQDTYKLAVSDTEGWALQFISDTLAVKGFNGTGFNSEKARLRVTMPNTPGVANLITVTATSQSDPEVSAKIYIVAAVDPGDDSDKDGSPDVLDDFDNDPEEWVDTDKDGIGNNADTDDDNDGMTDGWEIEHGTDPLIPNEDVTPDLPSPDDSVTVSGSGEHKMFVSPNSGDPAGEMQVTQEADGSYRGSNGSTSVAVVPDADATGGTFTFTIGKNLTETGEASAIMVKENDDGSHTYKVPASPEVAVKVNEDDSFEVTDAEYPGTVLNGRADGDVTVTDDEFPGMVFTEDTDGNQTVTDIDFPGMRSLINNGSQIVTDVAYPGVEAVVNEDGTYTITDAESPDTTIVYHPANETYTVTDTEFPGIVITFNGDGSYIVTDKEGKCYDISQKQRGLGSWIKKKIKRVVPLCPMACAISGFANKAAAISDAVGKYAEKVEEKAKEIREEAAKVEKKASKVERIAAKIAEWTRKRSRRARKDDVPTFNADGCEMITLYKASGTITGSDGNPIASTMVTLHDISGTDADDVIITTDNEGAWEVIALCRGDYIVTAAKDGYDFATEEFTIAEDNVTVTISEKVSFDTDGDGVADSEDAFPNDANEQLDTDGDGTGNNADTDDDNDGMPDAWELEYDLNPLADDASEDADDDGYSNFEEYDGNTNPFDSSDFPAPSVFEAGVFTVEDEGVVQTDWLYDGGMYKGELGIFSLSGMGDLEPGSEEFIAEAVRRVLSDSEEGHLVLSDLSEGARFSGSLGEAQNWNSGEYRGVRSFAMRPSDWFATILVPNGTFGALAKNPGTKNAHLRPLFSLVSSNPAYGMYLGQIADVSGMGMAFSYEDISADNSDHDYNDLIIQITGATIDEVPPLDSLTGGAARARRDRDDWFDWRSETELGGVIMEHLDAQIVAPETQWISADVNANAQLLAYDPQGRVIGETGGHIPGATFGADIDGYCFVSLPALEEGDYRLVIQGSEDESGVLTVRKHQGEDEILSEETMTLDIEAHQILVSDVEVASSGDGLIIDVADAGESEAGPYDFNGDGIIDDSDIETVSSVWNVCEGDEGYDSFIDLDDDGCITILDIMSVVSSDAAR